MSYYVVVTGLPRSVRKQKMIHFLRNFVFKKPHMKFWIESFTPESDSHNQMVLQFESKQLAETAAARLQDYAYQHTDEQIYILKCSMNCEPDNKEPAYNEHGRETQLKPVEYQRSYSQERSRSPHVREELSKIELEIELMNRKRMLVEAEQKLLMEQKRLEMLQKAGPSTVDTYEHEVNLTSQPHPILEKKRPQDQNNKAGENQSSKLYWPCRIIIKDIKRHVSAYIQESDRFLFYSIMRTEIKQRLKNLLQGAVILNTKKILAMYRHAYPSNTDEKFVIKVRDMIGQGHIPAGLKKQTNTGSTNAYLDGKYNNIDPLDLPIDQLSQDLDDWTEDGDVTN